MRPKYLSGASYKNNKVAYQEFTLLANSRARLRIACFDEQDQFKTHMAVTSSKCCTFFSALVLEKVIMPAHKVDENEFAMNVRFPSGANKIHDIRQALLGMN